MGPDCRRDAGAEPSFPKYLTSTANTYEACRSYLIKHRDDVDEVLDLVERVCIILENAGRYEDYKERMGRRGATKSPEQALDEINGRLLEARVGYRYGNFELMLVDSEFMHEEVTARVLPLLTRPGFEKANGDFMQAQKHLRNGDYKEAIGGAGDAVESTMKAICKCQVWSHKKGARATDLIKELAKKGLFPEEFIGEKSLEQLVGFLKAALPDLRNKGGAHGEAPDAPPVPAYLAAFALHEAAAYALMMIRALDALPPPQSG